MSTVTGYPQPPDPYHQPYHQPTGFIATPPPKKGLPTGAIVGIIIGGLVLLLCVGGIVAATVAPDTARNIAADTDKQFSAPPPAAQTTTPPPTTAPPTTAAGPLTSFGDGTYEIGTGPRDIAPGKYRTTAPTDYYACYWARLRGLSGSTSDIIANDLAQPGTQVIVQIAPTDKAFSATGCGTWTKA